MTDHPITPPPELVQRLRNEAPHGSATRERQLAIAAYSAGADAELEAILKMVGQEDLLEEDRYFDGLTVAAIRDARRPKPPTLAEQALAKIDAILNDPRKSTLKDELEALELSRRALKRLQELEQNNG